MEVDVAANAVEAAEHFLERGPAEVEDAVAVAAQPLHLPREVRAALGVDHHVGIGVRRAQPGDAAPRGPARESFAGEVAQHEARRVSLAALAMPHARLGATLEVEERLEEAV